MILAASEILKREIYVQPSMTCICRYDEKTPFYENSCLSEGFGKPEVTHIMQSVEKT